ncbi:hypothetical protein [Ferrovibrio terrae]|jgi:hypothetical protein|uniref:hypothetical protein n=1 Tax=Ferrovibrio terrae TaxID=2594003 RepID=UPI0031383A32
MSSSIFLRSRDVCMLERDWLDFGFALQDAYPGAQYERILDRWNKPEDIWQMPDPPDYPHHTHLLDTSVGPGASVRMIINPDWRREYYKLYGWYGMPEDQWCWDWPAPPPPSAIFRLGGYIYKEPVPHPSTGDITFYGENKNKDHMAQAGRFFRLLSKFTTNKKNLVNVRVPSMEVTVPVGSSSGFAPSWCGHHAIEWTRQEPDRVLFYARAGFGIRPTAEVEPFTQPPQPKAKKTRKKA